MQRWLTWTVAVFFPLTFPVVVAILALDSAPFVSEGRAPLEADYQRAKALLARLDPEAIKNDRMTNVTFSEAELNGALATVARGARKIRGRAVVSPQYGLLVGVSAELPLPENRIGRYLNVRATIAPSSQGLDIRRLAVGRIEVPAMLIMPAFRTIVDWLAGGGKGDAVVASVRHLRTEGKRVTVVYDPPAKMARELAAAAQSTLRASDPQAIRVYYARIAQMTRAHGTGDVSLASYVVPLFRHARERSATGDPVDENRAAILALAVFFGDSRIEALVGKVIPPELEAQGQRKDHVRLAGRLDYMQHFVTSAGLAVAGSGELAGVLGTVKEIDDSDGGSGFSFTDLAADRAGVRFAQVAVASPDDARRVQESLSAYIGERDIFPEIDDLPEGLTAAQFKARYGGTQRPAYHQMVAEIDRRIAAITLYR
jgi:hypothetical protein